MDCTSGSRTSIDTPEREFDELEFPVYSGNERERGRGSRSSGCRHKFFIRLTTSIVRVYISSGSIPPPALLAFTRLHDKKDHGAFVTSNSRIALFDVTIGRLGWKSPSATQLSSMLCKCHFAILSYVEGGLHENIKEMLEV